MLDKTFVLLQMARSPRIQGLWGSLVDQEVLKDAEHEVKLLRSLPEIVLLAGSARFKQAYQQIAEGLALQAKIVLGKHVFKPGDEWPLTENEKDTIHAIQFRMMDLASKLYVVNIDGYVGQDTYNLIRYACRIDKPVGFHEEHVRLLTKDGAAVTVHHFMQGVRRRVEFEEAAAGAGEG